MPSTLKIVFIAIPFFLCAKNLVAGEYNHSLKMDYYKVAIKPGTAHEDALKAVKQVRTSLNLNTDGVTKTDFEWRIISVSEQSDFSCAISDIDINAKTLITLPQFTHYDPDLHDGTSALLRHELLHFANHSDALAKIRGLSEKFRASCSEIKANFKIAADEILAQHTKIDVKIDVDYSENSF